MYYVYVTLYNTLFSECINTGRFWFGSS